MPVGLGMADIEYFFDPVCPFAWMTSKWVRRLAELRDVDVEWRFISLRLVNAEKDYDSEFPPGYIDGHTRGLELLRVAAAGRAAEGPVAVGRLYAAYGERLWDQPDGNRAPLRRRGDRASVEEVLGGLGLDAGLAAAFDDQAHDALIQAETSEALSRTGDDVGTPIVTYLPPDGLSFFGPVISRVPDDEQTVALWDAVTTLANFEGFAELKRSLREKPQLSALHG